MSNIAALLKQYSRESVEAGEEGELPDNQVGAEEILVVTDETTTELEEAIEEIADAVNGKEESEAALDSVIEATESLESAIESIRSARLRGQRVNGVAMQIWTNGVVDSMEARHIPSEIFQSLQEEFGDSFEADSYTDYSAEAEEKGEGIMTKLWNMIKAAFATMRDWFTKFLAWFGKSTEAIEKAGVKLAAAAKAKKGQTASRKTIPGGSYGLLVNGSTVDARATVKQIEDDIVASSAASIHLYTEAVAAAEKMEAPDVTLRLIKSAQSALKKISPSGKRTLPNGVVKTGKFELDANTGKVTNTVKVDMSKPKAFNSEVAVMSLSDIAALGDDLKALGAKARAEVTKVERSTGRNPSVNISKTLTAEQTTAARKAARAITGVMKLGQNLTSETVSFNMPIAKKAYSYGMVCLNQYK